MVWNTGVAWSCVGACEVVVETVARLEQSPDPPILTCIKRKRQKRYGCQARVNISPRVTIHHSFAVRTQVRLLVLFYLAVYALRELRWATLYAGRTYQLATHH